jgi:hypothetical protein
MKRSKPTISMSENRGIPTFFLSLYNHCLAIRINRYKVLNRKLNGFFLPMTCKGICLRHKAQKPVGSGRYASGQKRCQICEIFIKWDGLWCPCCGYRLRTKPRNLKYKAKLRAKTSRTTLETSEPPVLAVRRR